MMRLEPPNKFNFVAEQWPEWSAEFKRFRSASKLSKEDQDTQRDTLLYCMGRESEKIFSTFKFEEDQSFEVVLKKFDDYFIIRRNVIYERTKFQERKQKHNETVEEFYRDLRDLAKHCNYQDQECEQIRDRMVVGLNNKKVREKLQLIRDLTLDKVVEIARQQEQLEKQMESSSHDDHTAAAASELYRKKFNKFKKETSPSTSVRQEAHPIDLEISDKIVNAVERIIFQNKGAQLLVKTAINVVTEKIFGTTGLVNTTPVKIMLKDDAQPYNVVTPRRVPFPLQQSVKQELDKLEKAGIIQKTTIPTDWCAPMVPVRKKNGQIRICVDYKQLNTNIKRPNCMIPNLDDIAPKMVGAKFFSTLDASGGFYQIPLDEKSSFITTFITPYGRYRFKRVPMGISLGPETFQSKMEEILEDLQGCEPLSDDTIIYGRTEEEHDTRLNEAIERIENSGLRLNKEKCVFKKTEVKYFGHIISENGVRPDGDRVKAILKLKEPENVSELRTVLGMFNYTAKFVPQMSSVLHPMSALLKKETSFLWGPEQKAAFNQAKDKISNASSLAFFDINRPTIVSADASSYGIGGTLLQLDGDKVVPIAFASRTLSAAEKQYAQIEKECLASVWACEKFSRYLIGLPCFTLETDHKPLVPIMMKKDLDKTPIRCQRLLMRMMRFNAQVVHKAGKELLIADALSRFPLQSMDDTNIEEAVTDFADFFEENIPITTDRLSNIRCATVHDTELQQVMSYTLNGWPQRIPDHLIKYRQYIGDLSIKEGLLVMGNRIVIPQSQRKLILSKLHGCHQGLNKCRELAQTTVWWPGLTDDLKQLIETCAFCRANRPEQNKEPLRPSELPSRPWKQLGMDLCEFHNRSYLVVVDYYSRWIEIMHLYNTSSTSVVNKLKLLFATHGLPDVIRCDNGPQLVSKELTERSELKYLC
ncbi:hypothetical protein EGW08_020463 [Elysia chlorotica]|uniref:Integrase catalytic domain-containing protein n=1 Tax=Elysia chlorotica TaxID=188477 RepID=A0A3S1B4J1_ELYCH|nr:hypothetical protein EGW08_020463 [Elysia chlorotica]